MMNELKYLQLAPKKQVTKYEVQLAGFVMEINLCHIRSWAGSGNTCWWSFFLLNNKIYICYALSMVYMYVFYIIGPVSEKNMRKQQL